MTYILSNEQLALSIQSGQKENIPILYENVKYLLQALAGKFYQKYLPTCEKSGVEFEDLCQQAFFALLDAISVFDPDKEFQFTAYLSLHLKKQFQKLLGLRSSKRRDDVLNNAVNSLDDPLSEDNPDITLGDTILDKDSQLPYAEVLDGICQDQLSAAMQECLTYLSPNQRHVIVGYYYRGLTYPQIAAELNLTKSRVHQISTEAISRLQKTKSLKMLSPFVEDDIYSLGITGTGLYTFKNNQASSVERATEKIQNKAAFNS